MAESVAMARSGRDRWAKRIVQSSPAGWCSLSTLFRWRCQTTRRTAALSRRTCGGFGILVGGVQGQQAVGAAEVDDAHRLAVLALAGAVTAGTPAVPAVAAVDHTGTQAHPAAAGAEAAVTRRRVAVHIGHQATTQTGPTTGSVKTSRTGQ